MIEPQRKLNEAQTTILRLFGREMDEEEISELRDTLVDFLDKQLQKELDRVMKEKNISPENISNLGIKGNRTEYLNEIRLQKGQ
jgi:alpha-D-ribose 1-methylphosphonate 5-triphosphate synthase subunit PhnI